MEELDIRLLSLLIKDSNNLKDFSSKVGEAALEQEYRRFAKHLFSYFKTYDSSPTLHTLLEFIGASDNKTLTNYITETWNKCEILDIDVREYSFLFEKLKKRYNTELALSLHEQISTEIENGTIDQNIDRVNDLIVRAQDDIKEIGKEKDFVEISFKDGSDEWAKKLKASIPDMQHMSAFRYC